jgi:hypothetical protein
MFSRAHEMGKSSDMLCVIILILLVFYIWYSAGKEHDRPENKHRSPERERERERERAGDRKVRSIEMLPMTRTITTDAWAHGMC